jgi:hypothetical protein
MQIVIDEKEDFMEKAAGGKEKRYHRVCIFLTDQEMEDLYEVVYKEKTIPSKIFRKALMSYIDKSLHRYVEEKEENEEPIVW